jgi:uncharacterized protein
VTLYVDSSALLKRYLSEPDSSRADSLLRSDPHLVTTRLTSIEVRRSLSKNLTGPRLDEARDAFQRDWTSITKIELGEAVCERAAEIAEATGLRTLDAAHLGAAFEAGGRKIRFLTYDTRQARVARSLGWTVLGAGVD